MFVSLTWCASTRNFLLSCIILILVGCAAGEGHIRPITASSDADPQDALLANDWMKYRDTSAGQLIGSNVCAKDQRKTVFFVTLSGGGSRAAYFSARVLHELDKIGLTPITPYIDGIFSVSGGSLTAALYGLSRNDTELLTNDNQRRPIWTEDLTRSVLSKNLALSMVNELIKPGSLLSYFVGEQSRTDLLEASIEKEIFMNRGDAFSFRSLNPSRPPIFIISTIATTEGADAFDPAPFGSLFIFARPDLTKIGVDSYSIPIAKAVSASAAFPGLLSPVTIPRYRLSSSEKQLGNARYIHLIDGGNADNLGLLGVKRALLENDYRLLRECDNIVVLSVDAFGRQGVHDDVSRHKRSAVGWFFDSQSALASFDALLAANRVRLLSEFKSRVFMPPGSEELCRKDGMPDSVCGGGVRADWQEINSLVKQKLLFVHLNFESPELISQTPVTYCKGAYGSPNPQCEKLPVDDFRLLCERRQLKRRLESIPTTFGLSADEAGDIQVFVSLLNHPKNICLQHLSAVVSGSAQHNRYFYERASASCDETPDLKRGELPLVKENGHVRGRIWGDFVLSKGAKREETFDEACLRITPNSHNERMEFLEDAKKRLTAAPRFLR